MRKVLIDEGVPHGIRGWIHDADIFSVQWMGWEGIKNGELIKRLNDNQFDVVICNDKQWQYQQNTDRWKFGLIVLSTSRWRLIKAAAEGGNLIVRLNTVVQSIAKGAIIQFEVGGDDI